MHVTFRSIQAPTIAAVTLAAVIGVGAAAPGSAIASQENAVGPADAVAVNQVATTTISDEEAAGLVFMREEEKLARDVYVVLGDMWGLPIFDNIASAESTHMDSILGLLDAYGLDDPAANTGIGVFESSELQSLYDDLIAMGSVSPEAALEVGAIIEETDIIDIEQYLAATDAPDITRVYENLLAGSLNHLKAFVSQLEAAGIDREPFAMTPDDYAAALDTTSVRGSSTATRTGPTSAGLAVGDNSVATKSFTIGQVRDGSPAGPGNGRHG